MSEVRSEKLRKPTQRHQLDRWGDSLIQNKQAHVAGIVILTHVKLLLGIEPNQTHFQVAI